VRAQSLARDFRNGICASSGKGIACTLEARIALLKLGERIELAGTTPAYREYRRAQLFVLPSLYESFGLQPQKHCLMDCRGGISTARDRRADRQCGKRNPGRCGASGPTNWRGRFGALRSPDLRERLGRRGPLFDAPYSKEKICDRWEAMLYECR